MPDLYYIQKKGFIGNCLIWWAEGGSGYTCNLDEAWKVTREEAEKILTRDEDVLWPVAQVMAFARQHVTEELLKCAS